ncbi:tRNA-splicing endonuclease subunit Sen34 [Lampris incognitus]|uniref:tRNA-splicing endonuclease subunit Sen34 n=1 Tax=Lampris incognitus TaxID=2546036 RepID=UPI0024B48074|nr:tRNA-splicing endonuclease subunit Sen34 [Lampris incognitus]
MEQREGEVEERKGEVEQSGTEREERSRSACVVGVSLCGSTPLLWRCVDLRAVRDRGLVGSLVGSLTRQPRQNCRLGRPLQLLREEARLLAETGAAKVVPAGDEGEAGGGSAEEQQQLVQQYEEEQQRSFEEQSVLALQDRKSTLLRALTDRCPDGASEALTERLEVLDRTFSFPRSAMAVQLNTARARLSYCPEEKAFLKTGGPQENQNQRAEVRFSVFRDLRRRGFHMTSAGKFGGDFLVYSGDPLRFHAHFIAVCLSLDESVCSSDVLVLARLGSNVKKTVLLCSPGQDEVTYTSLQWSGMV